MNIADATSRNDDLNEEETGPETARKLAVVTGASTGIGYELAKVFAERGYDLVIAAEEGAIAEAGQSLRQLGVEVEAVRANLAKPAGVRKLFKAITDTARPVDALALNAGVAVYGDFTRENSWEHELNLINLNVTSVVHLAKLVLPEMVERGEGKVLITSSVAALMPGPMYATYAASKSFLLSFSEALYNELKGTGVTVTALMPGATETEFFNRAGMEDTKIGQSEKDSAALVAKQGYDAMMKGLDHFIGGGLTNRLQGFATRFLTEQQLAGLQRQMAERTR